MTLFLKTTFESSNQYDDVFYVRHDRYTIMGMSSFFFRHRGGGGAVSEIKRLIQIVYPHMRTERSCI